MSQWTEEKDVLLSKAIDGGLTAHEASLLVGESERACRKEAALLGKGFAGAENQGLHVFLRKGGRLVREEIGAAVGTYWTCAHRSGSGFNAELCESLLALGLLVKDLGSNSVFHLKGVDHVQV